MLTTGRQDYGILRSTLRAMRHDPRFELLLYAGGMHCAPRFGHTVDFLREDGCEVAREIPFVSEPPDPVTDTAAALAAVGSALAADQPHALLLVGDRSETLAAAMAASLLRIPLVHVHGGEETEGAVDNAFRHALTKLSHLHLVSHDRHAQRVLQMGEHPDGVVVVGAPGLDHLCRDDLVTGPALERALGTKITRPLILVTMHPTTLHDLTDETSEVGAVARALEHFDGTQVITLPNADTGGSDIRRFWTDWARGRSNVLLRDAVGDATYWGLMREADVMVGNSSSGVIEAPAAALPVVNVGDRQRGRLRGRGVVDVPPNAEAITAALRSALEPGHRSAIAGEPTLYAAPPAAPRIIAALIEWLPRRSLRKEFRPVSS